MISEDDEYEYLSKEINDMEERIVTVSRYSPPEDLPENHIWIFVKERELTANYIASAIRMRPDKLVISSELFGLFRIVASAAAYERNK